MTPVNITNQHGRGFNRILLVIVGLWIAGTIVHEMTGPAAPPNSTPTPSAALPQSTDPSYASNPTRNDWPSLGGQSLAPGKDLSRVNYYIVVDGSGSMQQANCSAGAAKIDAAVAALGNFIESVPADANLGLAAFDRVGLSERVPLGANQHAAILDKLSSIQAYNATPLRSAITLAYRRLTEQARRQFGYGEYHLVVVTDGHADPSSEDPSGIVQKLLDESPVLLHVIGFCIGTNHVLNQPGRTLYRAADNPEQLRRGLADVLAEAPSFDLTQFPGQ